MKRLFAVSKILEPWTEYNLRKTRRKSKLAGDK